MTKVILAAGAVCWRLVNDDVMVLLVHRTKQQDVSLPKGKLDPGETLPQAAVREVAEETGLRVRLGANLGRIHYELDKNTEKMVSYWAAEVTEGAVRQSTFRPNGEISALEWVELAEAKRRLSYDQDREVLKVFQRLVKHNALRTFAVVLLRHAKAEPRSEQFAVDAQRPLAAAGEAQAIRLAPTLAAFGIKRIYASDAQRCISTVEPLAHWLEKKIRLRHEISQDAWDAGEANARRLMGKLIRRGKSAVICSHRPLLPDLARELALATGSLPGAHLEDASDLAPSAFSVFHFSATHPSAGIISIETYPSA